MSEGSRVTVHLVDVLDGLAALERAAVRIQTIVTSPPYYALRVYAVEPRAWPAITYVPMLGLPPVEVPAMDCALGLETTPEAYVAHLVHVFRAARPVLRDDGTLWLNLGDSYANDSKWGGATYGKHAKKCHGPTGIGRARRFTGIPAKNTIGIPWRVAFALQADGWVLRSAPPWVRTNSMPDSTEDRPGNGHEQFFLFAKQPDYFYDPDAVRLPARETQSGNTTRVYGEARHRPGHHQGASVPWKDDGRGRHRRTVDWFFDSARAGEAEGLLQESDLDPTILPEDDAPVALVVRTRPHQGSHTATFPEVLVEPCLKASTSAEGCCGRCGAPWTRLVAIEGEAHGSADDRRRRTVGWRPGCGCDVPRVPCRVLDLFAGTGTVGAVAVRLGLDADLIECDPTCLPQIDARLARARRARVQLALAVEPPVAPLRSPSRCRARSSDSPWSRRMKSELTVREKILVAAVEATRHASTVTAGDLIVCAFRQFPESFTLASALEPAHPDSNRVLAKLAGVDGLIARGWLVRVETSVFAVTPQGRKRARQLVDPDAPPKPPPPARPVERTTAPRTTRRPADPPTVTSPPATPPAAPREVFTPVERYLVHDLARKVAFHRFERGGKLTLEDARTFWTTPRGVHVDVVTRRLASTGTLLERVAANVAHGFQEPELPAPTTCLKLLSLHRLLASKFGDAVRNGAEVGP